MKWSHLTGVFYLFEENKTSVTTGLGHLLTWICSVVWSLAVGAPLMGLGPLSVCSHGVFMEGNVSCGGPSFLHRRADHRLPGKGLVAGAQWPDGTGWHALWWPLNQDGRELIQTVKASRGDSLASWSHLFSHKLKWKLFWFFLHSSWLVFISIVDWLCCSTSAHNLNNNATMYCHQKTGSCSVENTSLNLSLVLKHRRITWTEPWWQPSL